MRKLKLDIETLSVESFAVDPEAQGQGTVKGHSPSPPWTIVEPTVCEDASCVWTQCNNISCFAQCGSGGHTLGGDTCTVSCRLTPPDIE
jgi:hypothetical protein